MGNTFRIPHVVGDDRGVVIPILNFLINGPLRNPGEKCWYSCGQRQGPCSFCGGGICCRKHWWDYSGGCNGYKGCYGYHCCVRRGGW